jgi:histidine ammonia-lyase
MVKLLQAPFSGLSAGLGAIRESPDDGLSELAVAGQAITVEARPLAYPVSYELASSAKGEGVEDRATMAPLSARRLADMVQLCTRVVAIELVVAAQAIDLRQAEAQLTNALQPNPLQPDALPGAVVQPHALGAGTARAYRTVRELIPFMPRDGTLPDDLEPLIELIGRGEISHLSDQV